MEAKLGSGTRFGNLKHELAGKGARNPGALAAYIGRKKLGAEKFNALSHKANGGMVGESDDDATTNISGAAKSPNMKDGGMVTCMHCGGETPGYAKGGMVGKPPPASMGPEKRQLSRDEKVKSDFAATLKRGR